MKYVRYTLLLFFGILWIAGCSSDILNFLYRTETIPDDYRYGDLYRLSNLGQFKELKTACPPYPGTKSQKDGKKVALYIIGDSFTEPQRVDQRDFGVDYYQYAHWGTILHLKLDTNYTNIVMLESVERKVREHFASPIALIQPDSATFITVPQDPRLVTQVDNLFSSTPVEDRLTIILFQFDSILKIKELKSWINYTFFERTDPKVTVSKGGEHVVYVEDTDTDYPEASYSIVNDSEIDTIVNVMARNKAYLHQLGFDQVWLSMIPNKASILMPDYGVYNHLIERIQGHPALEVPFIDIYQDFSVMKEAAYLRSDSHWTCEGRYRWLEKVNDRLNRFRQNQPDVL